MVQELGNSFLRGYYGGQVLPGQFGGQSGSIATPVSPLLRGQTFMTLDQSDPEFKDKMRRQGGAPNTAHCNRNSVALLLQGPCQSPLPPKTQNQTYIIRTPCSDA